MLYLDETARLQSECVIRCHAILDIDAASRPWVLLALDVEENPTQGPWRVFGAYASKADAFAAVPQGEMVLPGR